MSTEKKKKKKIWGDIFEMISNDSLQLSSKNKIQKY